jgi:HupE / UreJ protein
LRGSTIKILLRWLTGLFVGLVGFAAAHAHLTPTSSVGLDFADTHADVTITIPQGELGFRYGKPQLSEAELRRSFSAIGPDGRRWTLGPMAFENTIHDGVPDFIARFRMTPPPGQSARVFKLNYNAIIDTVPSHSVLVVVQSDFAAGLLQGDVQMIGALRNGKTQLAIDRGDASRWSGFAAAFGLGMQHIAEGFDHLLFLLTLLLPAPLLAAGGRWAGPSGRRQTIRHLIWIVSAFTIGHSVTLICGAVFGWALPSQPVEIAIALSILISAIHAARPLFPGREALVAGGFGLIHGLAFATVIGNFALQPLDKGIAILGFNLGIEAVQLIVVAIVLPLLLWLAATPAYRHVRLAGALVSGAAALFWVWERAWP